MRISQKSVVGFLLIASASIFNLRAAITTLEVNDPTPIFTIAEPHGFLFTKGREKLKNNVFYWGYDHLSFSISPFYQKASQARTFDKKRVRLGDRQGRWHMLGLLYGPRKEDDWPNSSQLCCAQRNIFPFISDDQSNNFETTCTQNIPLMSCTTTIPDQDIIFDPMEQIGFFSVPSKYTKAGIRFEFSIRPFDSIGFTAFTGVADLKQTLTWFIDETISQTSDTCEFVVPCPSCVVNSTTIIEAIACELMDRPKACLAFKQIDLDISDYHETGIEDVWALLWWRKPFHMNEYNGEWPEYSFVPFASVIGSYPTGKKTDLKKAFALPLGNDGHASVGFLAGFDIDFYRTIAIGLESGYMHFMERQVNCLRIPTQEKQQGVFPYYTDVDLQPGNNFHIALGFHAFRYVDKLSFYLQYIYISHQRDEITFIKPLAEDRPYNTPEQRCESKRLFERMSDWTSQMINAGFNYDISPYMSLGGTVQAPVSQRNAFRTTTYLLGFRLVF